MEQAAGSGQLDFLVRQLQPSGQYVADQGNIQAVSVSGVIIFPHVLKHVQNADTAGMIGYNGHGVLQ